MKRRWMAFWRTLGAFSMGLVLFGCEGPLTLSPCDIRERTCQDDVFYVVQKLRGALWDPWVDRPPMRVISAEQYREELLAARARADDGPMPTHDYFEQAMELLRLLDPDRAPTADVDAQVSNVAAYYSYGDRAITIIDHGEPEDLMAGTRVLAHELVHAAQDLDIGLGSFRLPSTRDGNYARQAVIEGEARMYENLVYLLLVDLDLDDADWETYHDSLLRGARERVFEDDSPQLQMYGLLYPLGASFLTERYLHGGNVAIRETWNQLPSQVWQVMNADRSDLRSPEPPLACAAAPAPMGYTFRGEVVLGALPLFGVATRFAETSDQAWELALGWRADRLSLYTRDEAHTLLRWDIRLADDRVEEFARGAEALYGETQVTRLGGGQVRILLASDEAFELWDALDPCGSPGE